MRIGSRITSGVAAVLAPLALGGCAWHPLSAEQSARLATFDCYWDAIAQHHRKNAHAGVDWEELRNQYRSAVPYADRPTDFYHLLAGMLSELRDMHVALDVPAENLIEKGVEPTSILQRRGFSVMPIEGRVHIVSWPVDGEPRRPARLPEAARYPELVRLEGFPVVLSLIHNLALGTPGSIAEMHLRWRDGSVTRHTMRRPTSARESARPKGLLRGMGSGRTHRWNPRRRTLEIRTFADRLPVAELDAAIDDDPDGEGLILDLRRNRGGLWERVEEVAGRFLDEEVTSTWAIPNQSALGGLVTIDAFHRRNWIPREPVYRGRLAILTSALTGSAAEHLARVLQQHASAIVVGERTAGAEAVVKEVEGPDGSQLTFGAIRITDRKGRGLQDQGVVPDISVRMTLEDVERNTPDGAFRDWESRLWRQAFRVIAGAADR